MLFFLLTIFIGLIDDKIKNTLVVIPTNQHLLTLDEKGVTMKTMIKTLIIGVTLLPCHVFAGTESTVCRAIEYPDHFEAVCTGNEKPVSTPSSTVAPYHGSVPVKATTPAQTTTPNLTSGTQTATSPKLAAEIQQPVKKQIIASVPHVIHRQHRPVKADMDAAIAARRALILEGRQNDTPEQVNTTPDSSTIFDQ